ncbi:MAG: tyrosine-type recombinase/integrase [Rubrivivax sp.]|nr:tyrosine-type recombinase/integrase [Rubrivivax sp.]
MAKNARRSAANLHRLTARQVHQAGEGDHADGGGLVLRVRAESASWVLRFTAPSGRRREMGLGACTRGSLAHVGASIIAARRQAHEARDAVLRGQDPIELRDARRAAATEVDQARKAELSRQRWTLCRCAREFHERVIEPTRTPKHAAQWIASLENHMPASLWRHPIDKIEPPELLQALLAIKPHERARNLAGGAKVAETVSRIRQRLDAVFEDAIFHRRCTKNPAAAVRRKMRETMPRKEAGQFAALPYKEAPALLARLREAQGTAARCLEFAVLTAARTSEALGAEWGEIDLEARTWLVPADRMKASGKMQAEAHLVHLSSRAVDLLRGQLGQHHRLVFPSTIKEDAQQSNMAMLAALDRLGVRDRTTVHGLCRATFSTWAYETAAARPDVIEACLAHREGDKVKAAYNRAQFNDERRALIAAWADYLRLDSASQFAPLKAA